MKLLDIFMVFLVLILSAGFGFRSTKVTERVIEHKLEADGKYYALL
jgi:hypothetical protein